MDLSIKTKVTAFIVTCVAVCGAALLWLNESSYQSNLQGVTEASIRDSRSSWESLTRSEVRTLSAVMQNVIVNKELLALWAAKDREKLLEASRPLFEVLRKDFGVTQFNYIDEQTLRLLIMTDPKDPKLIGTKADRFDVQEAARTKTWSSGLALGNHGFALRVAVPAYDSGLAPDGKLIGYLECGAEVGKFLASLKAQSGHEYGMVVKKSALDAEKWANQRAHLKLQNNWDQMKDVVLTGNTSADESIFSFAEDLAALPVEGKDLGLLARGVRSFSRGVFPINDASGQRVGAVFVLADVTALKDRFAAARVRTVVFAIALLIVLSLVLVMMLQSWVFKRLAHITDVVTNVVGGAYQTPVQVTKNDEIGRFEALFEQFRGVFVGLLQQYETLEEQHKKGPPPGGTA